MIDAAGIGRKIAAAVHREDLQLGMPLQHAVEDQVVQGDGGLERIADHVVEVEAREPLGVGEAVGMDDDERVELFGLLPERREVRLGELPCPRHWSGSPTPFMPSDFTQRSSSLAASPPSDERHGAERHEAVGLARDVFREPVVHQARGLDRDVERHGVEALVRRRHHQLKVDAHGVEIGEALVVAGDARADVLFLLLAQRLGLGVAKCASAIVDMSRCGLT